MSEFIEHLGKEIKVICSKDHGFGTDAILLSHFANPKKTDKCCDLGTGCGIIPLLFKRDGIKEVYAVEIQEKAIDQLKRSNELSNTNIKIYHEDLRNNTLPKGYFNVVTMNPPYKSAGAGILSETTPDQIARHEVSCTIDDAAKAAASLLNFGGCFYLCHRPERLADVITSMRKQELEPKKIRFVQKRPETAPWLFLIEGKKGAKPHIQVLPPLFIQDENGNESKELIEILGIYREE
ncbi:MAG: methyltransferase [Ruminococcaceae bacterium]|nr:methyltransferase [Oscillospiraceae bacterium]